MKKLLIFILLGTFVFQAKAQQSQRAAGARVMTVAEANQLNGVAQPTINGKPYSQHKAEQEALKRQREVNKSAVQQTDVVTINAANVKPAPAKVKIAQQTGPDAGTAPEPSKVVESAVTKVETKQPAKEVATVSPFPAGAVNKPAPVAEKAAVITGTSLDPSPVVAKPAGKSTSRSAEAAIIPATTVKAKAETTGTVIAPIPPSAIVETSPTASNSTSGQPEKPAAVPAPKQKSEQAPDAPVQEAKSKQGN